MKVFALLILVLFIGFFSGFMIGYQAGFKNLAYFDAPGRIWLYDNILEQNNATEFLDSEIVESVQTLMTWEIHSNQSFLTIEKKLLNQTLQGEMLIESFDKYSNEVLALDRFKKAIQFLCEWDEHLKSHDQCTK